MKLFTTILLLFAVATATASVAPQDLTVQYDVTSGTIVFRSTVALSHAAAFKLTDGNGNVVYKDSIAKEGFLNKRFKMAALGRSDYYKVTISDEVGETSLPIKVSAKEVVVNTNKAKHLFYPTLNFHSDRTLIVAYANKSKKRVDIKIATAQGQTVFSDQVSGTEGVRRAYQLDQLRSGDYQLIVSSGDVKNHTTAFALR